MDNNKEFDDLQCHMKSLDTSAASAMLSNAGFISKYSGNIIQLLGEGLTEENFINKPDYFNFCEDQLLKIARSEDYREVIFDFLELIDTHNCKLSSGVLAVVTLLENTESPSVTFLEYLLHSTFNRLKEMDKTHLKEILMSILLQLSKLNRHFQCQQSVMYYFARVAFLVLHANIDPIEYINALADIINDPFFLLEIEFEETEEKLYLASFFYLYFKTDMSWGPKIYNNFYVFEKCSQLAMSVFRDNDFGKYFTKLILTKFKDNAIPLHWLNSCHQEFCMQAAQCALYNEHQEIRKLSIDSLMIFIKKLTADAQYVTFKRLFSSAIDSNVKSNLVILMKEQIVLKMHSHQDLGHFQGVRLVEIIRLGCSVPDGNKCHVVEHMSFVMASITFLHAMHAFLTVKCHLERGKMLKMGTEFHDYATEFVKTVQEAIDYTSEQCELESMKLDNKVASVDNQVGMEPSKEDKRDMLSTYNTNLRLIQSHLNLLKKNYQLVLNEKI